jgi:hypothetical protein
MNERIKELSKEAYEDTIRNTPSMLITREDFENNFARAIINECLSICEEMGNEGKDGHYCADAIARKLQR